MAVELWVFATDSKGRLPLVELPTISSIRSIGVLRVCWPGCLVYPFVEAVDGSSKASDRVSDLGGVWSQSVQVAASALYPRSTRTNMTEWSVAGDQNVARELEPSEASELEAMSRRGGCWLRRQATAASGFGVRQEEAI